MDKKVNKNDEYKNIVSVDIVTIIYIILFLILVGIVLGSILLLLVVI